MRLASIGVTGAFTGSRLEARSLLAGSALQPLPEERRTGTLPFLREDRSKLNRTTGSGLAGRRALDLSTLESDSLVVSNQDFFIRTRAPDPIDRSRAWQLSIGGLASQTLQLEADQLVRDSRDQGLVLTECSGNSHRRAYGLISAARWSGVPVGAILRGLSVPDDCRRLLIGGVDPDSGASRGSDRGASWSFPIAQLIESGAFLATHMNGAPLPADHGHPVRLVIPGWYGCCWIKWVDRVVFQNDGVSASGQMREFAGRTHQTGVPVLAKDYQPALIDQTAMPVRVEKWTGPTGTFYRIVGISWGGSAPTRHLQIKLGKGVPWTAVHDHPHLQNATWTLWTHSWRPAAAGLYPIHLRVKDKSVRTRRLDQRYYRRVVRI